MEAAEVEAVSANGRHKYKSVFVGTYHLNMTGTRGLVWVLSSACKGLQPQYQHKDK